MMPTAATGMPCAVPVPTVEAVAEILGRHVRLYRRMRPVYQQQMLASLATVWDPRHRTLLDVGGGTGLLAEAMRLLLGLTSVTSVDVEDRFLPALGIETALFSGSTLPFADRSFDAVVLNNVLHHVAVEDRVGLVRECARVSRGPVYIKDHLPRTPLDTGRLIVLDILGNAPFSGMIRARYLSAEDWRALAGATGLRIAAETGGTYRSGPFARLFPNRLETTMRWMPAQPNVGARPGTRITAPCSA